MTTSRLDDNVVASGDGNISREARIAAEVERIQNLRKKYRSWFTLQRMLSRILIRSVRIAFGAVIVLLVLKSGGEAIDIASEPFATLTILKVFGFLFFAWFAIFGFYVAIFAAFGPGPSTEDDALALREEASANVAVIDLVAATEMRKQKQKGWLLALSGRSGRCVGKALRRIRRH